MKYFKVEASRNAPRYEITPENFVKATGRNHPFEQKNKQNKISVYGICPSCLNPIQLIGIATKIKGRPYGKHAGKNIEGLPKWNFAKYKYCPFAACNTNAQPDNDERLAEPDEAAIELYRLLKEQFDRVVTFLSNELEIRCSKKFWESALQAYVINRAYCYPWLTEANLPYVFAYYGIHHQSLFMQRFRVDSDIYNALAALPDVEFKKSQSKGNYERLKNREGCYLQLFFRFTNHTYKAKEGKPLQESMLFCVDDRKTGRTVFEKKLFFNETYFANYLKKESERKQWLLDIADEMMIGI